MKRYFAFLLAVILTFSLSGCGDSDPTTSKGTGYDVIGDLKEVIFDSYGDKTLEEAVDYALSDAEWEFNDTPEFSGGTLYHASVAGTLPDGSSQVCLSFTVLYKYRQMSDDPQEIEVSVDSITVDDTPYSDIDTVMRYLYGVTSNLELKQANTISSQNNGEEDMWTYITLKELADAYNANALVAEQTYADRYYYVRGTVGAIYSVYENQPVVQLTEESSDSMYTATFKFDSENQDPYRLQRGDRVVLGGYLYEGQGAIFTDAILQVVEEATQSNFQENNTTNIPEPSESEFEGNLLEDFEDGEQIVINDFEGDYTYGEGTPFEDTSCWLHIELSPDHSGLLLTSSWMGSSEFDNTFVNADCLEGNKLVFKFTPGGGFIEEYCLEFVPAENSPLGSDLIYMDDNDVPYVKGPGM